tara:strand:+ start:381 stop:878 length:498 start_codon:yes stop_codon:yes gene_type:complete
VKSEKNGTISGLPKPFDKLILFAKFKNISNKIGHVIDISGNGYLVEGVVTVFIDFKITEELKEQLGIDVFRTLFDCYITETETMISGLSEPSAKNQDVTDLIKEIHKVAGSSATFGALEMHKALNQMEILGKESDAPTVISRLDELKETWNASKQSYRDQELLNA